MTAPGLVRWRWVSARAAFDPATGEILAVVAKTGETNEYPGRWTVHAGELKTHEGADTLERAKVSAFPVIDGNRCHDTYCTACKEAFDG